MDNKIGSLVKNLDFLRQCAQYGTEDAEPQIFVYSGVGETSLSESWEDAWEDGTLPLIAEPFRKQGFEKNFRLQVYAESHSMQEMSETAWSIVSTNWSDRSAFARHLLDEYLCSAVPVAIEVIREADITALPRDLQDCCERLLRLDGKHPVTSHFRDCGYGDICDLGMDFFRVEIDAREYPGFGDRISDEMRDIPDDRYYFGYALDGADGRVRCSLMYAHQRDSMDSFEEICSMDMEDFLQSEIFREKFSAALAAYTPLQHLKTPLSWRPEQQESASPRP